MDKNNDTLELALGLFQFHINENNKLQDSIIGNFQITINELEKELTLVNSYIYYVEKCIKLQTVPHNFDFWYKFIR